MPTDFIPKYLARRVKARASGLEKLAGSSHGASPATEQSASTYEVHQGTRSIVTTPAPAPAPPALSALPASFHKRYLVNFTVLLPEQQRAAQQAEREKKRAEVEGRGHRRWRGGGARGAWDATPTGDRSKAAFRELARRGVLEREDVKAMLRPGPLQDFRGSVLQVGLVGNACPSCVAVAATRERLKFCCTLAPRILNILCVFSPSVDARPRASLRGIFVVWVCTKWKQSLALSSGYYSHCTTRRHFLISA